MTEKSPFSKIDHIEITVRDVDRVTRFYESIGLGPFTTMKAMMSGKEVMGQRIKPDELINKTRSAQIGTVQLHVAQPFRGETMQKRFLETKGEGIDHICFSVDDIDKEVARLEKKGLKVIYRSWFQNGGGTAFFDTSEFGGFPLELIQWPPQ